MPLPGYTQLQLVSAGLDNFCSGHFFRRMLDTYRLTGTTCQLGPVFGGEGAAHLDTAPGRPRTVPVRSAWPGTKPLTFCSPPGGPTCCGRGPSAIRGQYRAAPGRVRRWPGLCSGAGSRVFDLARFSTSRGNEAHFSQANRNHSRGPRVPGYRGKPWSELASWRRIFLPLPATS